MRTAKILGEKREQRNISQSYGSELQGTPCPDGSGHLVVIFEKGFIKSRSSFRIPFIWDGTILQIVLPFYDMSGYTSSAPLEVSSSATTVSTSTICNLDAMAVRSLKEHYNGILLRQILRMVAKYHMQKEADKQGFGFVTMLANVITDRADDRNWLTLPEFMQVADVFLPAGQHKLNCRHLGLSKDVTIDIEERKTQFLIITQLGARLVVQGKGIVEAPVPPNSIQ
jgi:hypothetical protein